MYGYHVMVAHRGAEGLQLARRHRPDMFILDVMMPGMDGFEVCERIREHDRQQPIIMLTAKTADEDIINGLRLGADDYVAKPFSIAQLIARVESVMRRSQLLLAQHERICLESLEIDPLNLCGHRGDVVVQFTRREMDILSLIHI